MTRLFKIVDTAVFYCCMCVSVPSNAHLPPGFVMPDLSKPPPSLHSRRIVGSSTPQLPPKNFAPPPPTVAPPHVAPPPPSISQVPKVTTTPRIKFGPAPPPPTPRQPKLVPEGKPIPSYEWSGGPAEYYEDLYGDEKICTSPGPECYMEYYTDGPGQSNDNEKDQEVKTSDK